MINLYVNNKRTIELSKTKRGTIIEVNVIDSNGETDYRYGITEADMVELLKKFERENNIS